MSMIIKKQLSDNIQMVSLNRPESLNAIVPEMLTELVAAFKDLNRDRETRVVILTGEGKGFCAGADLSQQVEAGAIPGTEGMSRLGFVYKYQELLVETILAIHECEKPVIAAINGAAVGGGLGFALAADMRIAVPAAKMGAVYIKTGLSACDMGTSYFLPRLIPPAKALELMLTGRIFKASEAVEWGLLNDVAEPENLIETAIHLADEIMENSEYGVWMTKKGFWTNLNAPGLRHATEIENRTQALGYFTGCMEEMMEAFVEGRKPRWKPL